MMAALFVGEQIMFDTKTVLVIAFIAVFGTLYMKQYNACEAVGGTLMKPAVGWYTCVKPVK